MKINFIFLFIVFFVQSQAQIKPSYQKSDLYLRVEENIQMAEFLLKYSTETINYTDCERVRLNCKGYTKLLNCYKIGDAADNSTLAIFKSEDGIIYVIGMKPTVKGADYYDCVIMALKDNQYWDVDYAMNIKKNPMTMIVIPWNGITLTNGSVMQLMDDYITDFKLAGADNYFTLPVYRFLNKVKK
jgi:hypothetical protein